MKIIKILFLLFILPLAAYDDRPACFKALERDFFDYDVTTTAFGLWRVPQGQWNQIMKLLKERELEAEGIIKKKSSGYKPNPLQNPFKPDVAKTILKETMRQIFLRVMIDSGFFDPVSIGHMFDFVWENDTRINQC